MSTLRILTAAEQVEQHLRNKMLSGHWAGTMPGAGRLASELGVGRNTVEAALALLEKNGLLVNQGDRRKRLIARPEGMPSTKTLRLGILPFDRFNWSSPFIMEIESRLIDEGIIIERAPKSMSELKLDANRVARMVQKIDADAWIVTAGSAQVLDWFANQPKPTFAFFGRFRGRPIAAVGLEKESIYRDVVRRLVALGHNRIVLIAREERRKPGPGNVERAFMDELQACGISTGPYNLPDWEDSPKGFRMCMDKLFQRTPPTALIVQAPPLYGPVLLHLTRIGMATPRDVSLICTDEPDMPWADPNISHMTWNRSIVLRRVMKWARHVSRGEQDLRQSIIKANFVEGGTIGPAVIRE